MTEFERFIRNAKCLETRFRRDGLRMRRYRDQVTGQEIRTIEMPMSVFGGVQKKRSLERFSQACRGIALTRERAALRAAIHARLKEGWKPEAIAQELGCSTGFVQELRRNTLTC